MPAKQERLCLLSPGICFYPEQGRSLHRLNRRESSRFYHGGPNKGEFPAAASGPASAATRARQSSPETGWVDVPWPLETAPSRLATQEISPHGHGLLSETAATIYHVHHQIQVAVGDHEWLKANYKPESPWGGGGGGGGTASTCRVSEIQKLGIE